jgi:XTP/dITP diphosphohydrolase
MLPGNIQILSLTDIGCHEDIPETATPLKATPSKANYVTQNFGYDCFADDSGLKLIRCMVRPAFILPGMGEQKRRRQHR